MVVAIPSPTTATPIAVAASTVRAHKSPSPHYHCPLAPFEKDNAALSRKPHAKEISSRFLPSSSSSSTSTSRCAPSPLPTSSSSGPKCSHSVDRSYPSAAAKGSGATPPQPPGPSAPPPGASLSPSRASPSSSRPARPSPSYLLPSPGSPHLTTDVSLGSVEKRQPVGELETL